MTIKKEDGTYMNGKEFGELFMKFCNDMSIEIGPFAEVVTNDHPTLQQTAFRVMWNCIERWARKEYFDLRNEGTIKACRKIVEAFEKPNGANGLYLPFI